MVPEEPLNVTVARAIGWTQITWNEQGGWGRAPEGGTYQSIPRYGHNTPDGWTCTGPLLDKYVLALGAPYGLVRSTWIAESHGPIAEIAAADSACEAVARLVIRLGELGKL